MPIGQSNSGSSFYRPVEMCLGDQNFVPLFLYSHNIHVFAASINEMLDRTKMVFKMLKDFNLKIITKNATSFSKALYILDIYYQLLAFLLTQKSQ